MKTIVITAMLAAGAMIMADGEYPSPEAILAAEGIDCPLITDLRVVGPVKKTEILVIAVACNSGGKHALLLSPEKRLSYVATCELYDKFANLPCFEEPHNE